MVYKFQKVITKDNVTQRFDLNGRDCCIHLWLITLLSRQDGNVQVEPSHAVAGYLVPNYASSPTDSINPPENGAPDNVEENNTSENQTRTNKANGPDAADSVWDEHDDDARELTYRAVTPPPDSDILRDETVPVSSDALPSSSPDVSMVLLFVLTSSLRSLLCHTGLYLMSGTDCIYAGEDTVNQRFSADIAAQVSRWPHAFKV